MPPLTALGIDPYAAIQAATRAHRASHGCGAYTFEDGPALRLLASERQPQRILEMGTALGYTACSLASGSTSAQVDTIEADVEHVGLAREQIERVGLSERVAVHHGRFEDILPTLEPGYGLAFFDGFAPDPAVLRVVRQLLEEGGVLVCANLQLASGSVVRVLLRNLDDQKKWQREPSIEGGATQVFIKRWA